MIKQPIELDDCPRGYELRTPGVHNKQPDTTEVTEEGTLISKAHGHSISIYDTVNAMTTSETRSV